MEELGINPSNNIPADGKDINQIKNVKVDRSPSSTMKMNETIKVMYKGLRVKFDKGGIIFIRNPGMEFVPNHTHHRARYNDYGETPGKWMIGKLRYDTNPILEALALIHDESRYNFVNSLGDALESKDFITFCNKMISDGIPPKFIANNCYLAASSEMNTVGSKDKPIWGQTRLVLFPKNLPRVRV